MTILEWKFSPIGLAQFDSKFLFEIQNSIGSSHSMGELRHFLKPRISPIPSGGENYFVENHLLLINNTFESLMAAEFWQKVSGRITLIQMAQSNMCGRYCRLLTITSRQYFEKRFGVCVTELVRWDTSWEFRLYYKRFRSFPVILLVKCKMKIKIPKICIAPLNLS